MNKTVPVLLMLLLISALVPNHRLVGAQDKGEVEFWMSLGAGFFSALLIVATWAFGGCLELSLYIHLAAIHVSNDITVASYKSDSNYALSVVPSDLTLFRNQTDSPDFSESLNQMGNEAVNAVLSTASLSLALATATNRYYTAQAEAEYTSAEKQRGDIKTFFLDLTLAEDEAADKLVTFATVLASEGPDPNCTQQQFIDFQNMVNSTGFPQEEVDLLNLLVSRADPILFDGFDYLGYLENMTTSLTCPYSELSASDATLKTTIIRHTSQVIGPFPGIPPVGGIVIPVDEVGLLAPYIGLVSTIIIATVVTVVYGKRVWRRRERQ